jgi:N-acetylneuraminic acid mutarotase
VYRFDGTNWQETTGLPALRSGLRAVAHSNRLLAIGGYYGGYRTNVYALDGGGWWETAGLPEGLERFRGRGVAGRRICVGRVEERRVAQHQCVPF